MQNRIATQELDCQLVELACLGLSARSISERLGASNPMVRSRLYRLRISGLCPGVLMCRAEAPIDPKPYIKEIRSKWKVGAGPFIDPRRPRTNERVALGNMGVFMSALGYDLAKRLCDEVPIGMTVAEYIAAFVKDALLEEKA